MLDSHDKMVAFYREAYQQQGATPQGMRWSDTETHWRRLSRLKALLLALDIPMSRILDVGCGIGMLYKIWDLQHTERIYHGIDVVPEYIEEARRTTAGNPNAIVTCDDFLKWWAVDPFSVTVAVGAFAWQPSEQVNEIIDRMWALTMNGGAMAFTFIPDNPLSKFQVNRLEVSLSGVTEKLIYTGYSNRLEEHIAVFVKEEKPDWESAYPYKHQEEIEDEVIRGEHREEEDAGNNS